MTELSKDKFKQSKEFIYKNARPLDKSLFELQFNQGSTDAVARELSKYQNLDGGFGQALEPDFRLKASSPMATSVGLQYCEEIQIDQEHLMVKSAIDYLLNTYHSKEGYWPSTFMDVNNEPHAPWWDLEKVAPPEESDWANPSAELVGYLHKYSVNVPSAFLSMVTQRAQRSIHSIRIVKTLWPHIYNLMCWERASKHLPEPLKAEVVNEVRSYYSELGTFTADMLKEVRVFWVSPSPDSMLNQVYPDVVDDLLEAEISRQSDDGGWWPTWNWGQYEEVWKVAEREWAGKMTVDCLRTLQRFEKINT